MFESPEVEMLDGNAAADAIAETLQRIIAAEADQFRLAAHWVDLHAPELVPTPLAALPGMARAVRAGADGTGTMDEFAGAELAALLGLSTAAGEQYAADAVNVRHRHPLLWARVCGGNVRVWIARRVARRCAAAGLTAEQALWVDAETTPYVSTLTPGRFFSLVEAKILAADPAAAAQRAHEEALAQFARAGRIDEHGMRIFVARAVAGDVNYLIAVLERIAGVLAIRGDERPVDARMATALRILANPARALKLLTEATLEAVEPATGPRSAEAPVPVDTDSRNTALGFGEGRPDLVGTEHEKIWWMRDATGMPLPGVPLREHLQPLAGQPLEDALAPFEHGRVPVLGDQPGGSGAVEEGLDEELLREAIAALERCDPSRWDPVTVLHVHTSTETLEAGQGVVRVENVGPMSLTAVRRWLVGRPGPIVLKPVLDARAVAPVDRYEFTPAMKEVIAARFPHEVFPYGTATTRRGDHDHARPYDPGGPPGQTSLDNCTPLSRRHHRMKTFGRWILRILEPGVYWWRSPHGHWFRVDRHGTHRRGRSRTLDTTLLAVPE